MKHTFPATYGEDSKLVEIDVALIPYVAGALEYLTQRYAWATDIDYELGYNAFAQLKEELMGKGINRLIVEVRALRGGSFPAPNAYDPEADPTAVGLSTIGGVIVETAAVKDKAEEIRLLLELQNNAETLEEIRGYSAQIALLLA